jgi:SAM-dependent methyltransferase
MRSEITYLTQPESVSMGDAWFDIANVDHFWIRRRFQVLRQIAGDLLRPQMRIAEIGCGSGLLQRQLEDECGVQVDGFDLNEHALKRSVCRSSRRFCYNIFSRDVALREAYGAIFLFDVIEHIEDHRGFLDAVLFHLRPGGHLLINVPADSALFSAYDRAAGHVRRYLSSELISLVESLGLRAEQWTYWGWPLRLLLHIRRRRLEKMTNHDEILRDGFSPRGGFINLGLFLFSQFEKIPQHGSGSSLMLIARRPEIGQGNSSAS